MGTGCRRDTEVPMIEGSDIGLKIVCANVREKALKVGGGAVDLVVRTIAKHASGRGAAGTSEGGEGLKGQGRKKGGEEVTPVHQKHAQREDKVGSKEAGYAEGASLEKGRMKQARRKGGSDQGIGAQDEGEVSKEIPREGKEVGKSHKKGKRTEAEKVETEEHAHEEIGGGENGSKGHKRKKKEGKHKVLEGKDGAEKTEIDEENEEGHAKDGEKVETKEEENDVDAEKAREERRREKKRLRREEKERRKSAEGTKEGQKIETKEEKEVDAEELRAEIELERKRLRREERERRRLEKTQGHAEVDVGGTDTGEPKPRKRKNKAKKNKEGKVEEIEEKMEEENEGEETEQGKEDEVFVLGMENKQAGKVEGGVSKEERRKERVRSEADISKAAEPEVVIRGKVKKGKEERGRKKEKCVEAVDEEERMEQDAEAGPSNKTPFASTTARSLECFQGLVLVDEGDTRPAVLYQIRLPAGCVDGKLLLTSGPGLVSLTCHSCDAVAFELHPVSNIPEGVRSSGHPPPSIPLATFLESKPASAAKKSGEENPPVQMDQADAVAYLVLDADASVGKEKANERRKEKAEKTDGDVKENETQFDEEGVFAEGTKSKSENGKEKKQRRKKKKMSGEENGNKTEAGGLALTHETSATPTAGSLGLDGVDSDMGVKVDRVEGQTRMNEREIANKDGGLDNVGQVAKSGDESKTRRKKKERLGVPELTSPGALVDAKLSEKRNTSKKMLLSTTNNEGVGAASDPKGMTVVGVPKVKSVGDAEHPEGSKEGEVLRRLSLVDGEPNEVDEQEGPEVISLITGGGETPVVAGKEVVEHGPPMDGTVGGEAEKDKEDGDGHVDGEDSHDDDPVQKRVGEQEGGEVNGGLLRGSEGLVGNEEVVGMQQEEAPIIDVGLAVGGGEMVVAEQQEPPAAPRPRARRGAAAKEAKVIPPPELRCQMIKRSGGKIWHCKNLKEEGSRHCGQHIRSRTQQAERRRAKRLAAKALMQQGEGGAGSGGEAPERGEGNE
eukprot:TRINITY_DN14378_c0_g3_i2.p1 TRINITY_DN14378_c0_g3~~TRINITY_DN14378_c0_g3_i2.p1  ORF type:complete len:1012 (+),score=362.33 TRINITY_DN14378_c0_g3_i2:243-3278(+)